MYDFWVLCRDQALYFVRSPKQDKISTAHLESLAHRALNCMVVPQSLWTDHHIGKWMESDEGMVDYVHISDAGTDLTSIFPELCKPPQEVQDYRVPVISYIERPYLDIAENRKIFRTIDQAIKKEEELSFENANIETNARRAREALERQTEDDEEDAWV